MSEINFQDEFRGADAGVARQLLNLRQTPSAALQCRVQAIPQQSAHRERFVPRLAWAAVGLILVALAFASPAVRAALSKVEEVVGRIHLTVTDSVPGAPREFTFTETEWMSLGEALAAVPFDFAMPTYVPDGFTTSGQAKVWTSYDGKEIVIIEWRDAKGHFFALDAREYYEGAHFTVGPDSSKTILINGQEAIVVSGGWNASCDTWNDQAGTTALIWEANGVLYKLMTFRNAVSLTELIAVAESVH